MGLSRHYSDEELAEFRQIINNKLSIARQSYDEAMQELSNAIQILMLIRQYLIIF